MNPTLPREAVDLHAAATRAFAAHGGVDLARKAESDPDLRSGLVAGVLDDLGVGDLDPRDDPVAFAAAATLCEAAGAVALPYPVAAVVVRDPAGRPTAAIPRGRARVDHGDLFPEWRVGVLGDRSEAATGGIAQDAGTRLGSRLGPFVTDLRTVLESADSGGPAPTGDLLIHQTLVAWTVIGTLRRAIGTAVDHVNGRVQFGRPIGELQAVRFQIADATVAAAGLRELASFTLWRVAELGDRALVDVLALRLHVVEVATAVLRTSQQLHGATGFCDEYDISILVRMAQPSLRLPEGPDRAASALAAAIRTDGFDGLFDHGAVRRRDGAVG